VFGAPVAPANQILNMAPLPPIFSTMLDEGIDGSILGPEALGITTFNESSFSRKQRLSQERFGKDYLKLENPQQDEIDADPVAQSLAEEEDLERAPLDRGAAARVKVREEEEASRADQNELDTLLSLGEIGQREWRELRSTRLADLRAFKEGAFGLEPVEPDPKSPDFLLQRYWQQIQLADSVQGVQWEEVDAWERSLTPEERDKLRELQGEPSGLTDRESEYVADLDLLLDAGYFDIRESLWAAFQRERSSLEQFDSYGAWSMWQARRLYQEGGGTFGEEFDLTLWDHAQDAAGKIAFNQEWTSALTEWRTGWAADNPQAAQRAASWDFAIGNREATFGQNPLVAAR